MINNVRERNPMPEQPREVRCSNFDEVALGYTEADAIREAIKEEMVRQNTEELSAGAYIVRYTSIISNRFDSTTFKRLYADLYKDFTKSVSSRRFSVSC